MFTLVVGDIRVPLPEDGRVLTIGRSVDSNIVCNDYETSRRHAEIRCNEGILEVRDLQSTNGTAVNEIRLPPDQWITVHPGQEIRVGSYRLVVEKADSGELDALHSMPATMSIQPAEVDDEPGDTGDTGNAAESESTETPVADQPSREFDELF